MKKILIIIAAVAAVAVVFYVSRSRPLSTTPSGSEDLGGEAAPSDGVSLGEEEALSEDEEGSSERQISLTTRSLGGSGVLGGAQLIEINGKVKVNAGAVSSDVTTPRPVHIHSGSCSDVGTLGPIVYSLNPIVNVLSETVLDTTFAKLKSQLPLVLNIHKSSAESGVYVACGEIPEDQLNLFVP